MRHTVDKTEEGRWLLVPVNSRLRKITLLNALKACSRSKDLKTGRMLHELAVESAQVSNTYVANTLLHMYAKCGSMHEARQVFDTMMDHTVVSWNALILGYAQNGDGNTALELFSLMGSEGCPLTMVAALKACWTREEENAGSDLQKVLALHCKAEQSSCYMDIRVTNTLISMYTKFRNMLYAWKVFEKMPQSDVVSWNALVLGYAENGHGEDALRLFAIMKWEGSADPNSFTLVAAVKACNGSIQRGFSVHHMAVSFGFEGDVYVGNALVDMYAKSEHLVDARRVFDRMSRHDVVSWNALIMGYAETGEGNKALDLFSKMENEGCRPNSLTFVAALKSCTCLAATEDAAVRLKATEIHVKAMDEGCASDIRVASSLISMYAKLGNMVDAQKVFDEMVHHDVISWTAIILGHADNGDGQLALELFSRMGREGCAPNSFTFAAALKACSKVGALEAGKAMHEDIREQGLQDDVVVATSLIDFYGKCWSMVDARQVFEQLPKRNLVAWTALLAGYSRHGDVDAVFSLFQELQEQQVQPNAVTFLCLLTACSHAGLIDKGKEYFEDMNVKYGIIPTRAHYTCLVDMLCRANRLDEAVRIVKSMPPGPDAVTWMAFLGGCRKWRNVKLARLAFDSLMDVDDKDSAAYVLMANVYKGN